MNIHERLDAFWHGGKPDVIPYTIYQNEWQHTQNDPAWIPLFEKGLGVTWHLHPYAVAYGEDIEVEDISREENGSLIRRQTWKTSIGDIYQIWENGWHKRHLIHDENDYHVMTYIVKNSELSPAYHEFNAKREQIMPYGVALSLLDRTPFQTMLVDYVGIENFAFHLYDYEEEVDELYEALLKQFRRRVELAADGPGGYIALIENFTAETVGPQRYEKFLTPVYEECIPILHQAGKVVGCHYDGRTACCAEQIKRAPFAVIESLTEPNEGDLLLSECRAAWPKKLFWSNIRVGDYQLPEEQLAEKVASMVKDAAVDGCGLAFEISESYPENWKTSVFTVLNTLQNIRI